VAADDDDVFLEHSYSANFSSLLVVWKNLPDQRLVRQKNSSLWQVEESDLQFDTTKKFTLRIPNTKGFSIRSLKEENEREFKSAS